MASIQKRPARTGGGSTTYRVRYRDPAGVERSRTFDKLTRAKTFQATVEADMARGTYVDQSLGRMTLGEYAASWLEVQTFGESTREQTAHRIRRHVVPPLGATPLSALRTSQVQSWVRAKQQELSPRTVRLLSSILNAAVDDERIAKNPCRSPSIKLPKLDDRKIVPWTDQQVVQLRRALPERYAVMLTLTTGLGLRQGEVFGIAVEDVNFFRGTVRVQRQVAIVGSKLVFSLPKNRKVREVPLPRSVGDVLSAYLAAYPRAGWRCPGRSRRGRWSSRGSS